ncbi:Ferritin-like domain-containing protein [Pedobacter steynii]|uniref:Ferritin-like domain-containing protein n=1 Tax=Pedobacter steynii TaxID=430522 RepID=A0A1G9JNA6_9SPHI|nr:ferritin-like domain-containing protein [Pedobacter steynii]NQX38307.1 ferritin-like domain-containing protein [Pedobacter steynii]SDL39040.1 Ferritin-like domain-containing protein [Pedobacter steynii]
MARDLEKIEAGDTLFLKERLLRRQFLKFTGATVVVGMGLSCRKEVDSPSAPAINTDHTIDFKSDAGLLNYIYALEQLAAAFYIKVLEAPAADFTAVQMAFLNDIKLHEIAHREYYKNFLGIAGIGKLEFNLSAIDTSSALSVLTAAKAFEDLGVAAYNGALLRAQSNYSFVILSQIASVEARHAAWIRNQISTDSFADLKELSALGAIAADGLDVLSDPAQVLAQVTKYISTKLNVINL